MLRLIEVDRASREVQQVTLQERFQEDSAQFALADILVLPPNSDASGKHLGGGKEKVGDEANCWVVQSTLARGYIQMSHVSNGTFSSFLTHIDGTPLEGALRCICFAPCLYAPTSTPPPPYSAPQHSSSSGGETTTYPSLIVYALAFSNQVLIADCNTGNIVVLDEYPCRPSVVASDGSHLMVGDGRGRLHAYRGATVMHHGGRASRIWTAPLSLRAVTHVKFVSADLVVAVTADYQVSIVSITTGTIVGCLAGQTSSAVAVCTSAPHLGGPMAYSLVKPSRDAAWVEILYENGVLCRFESAAREPGASPSVPVPWSLVTASDVTRHAPVTAKASRSCVLLRQGGGLPEVLLIGTDEGQVLHFRRERAESAAGFGVVHRPSLWREASRIEVASGVIAMAAARPDDAARTLVMVVTRGGDVWQWSMDELQRTDDAAAEEQEPEEAPRASISALRDEGAPAPLPASSVSAEVAVDVLVDAVLHEHEVSPRDNGSVELVENPESLRQGGGQTFSATNDGDDSVVIEMDAEADLVSLGETEATVSFASGVPSSVALTTATNHTGRDELLRHRSRPTGNVRFADAAHGHGTAPSPELSTPPSLQVPQSGASAPSDPSHLLATSSPRSQALPKGTPRSPQLPLTQTSSSQPSPGPVAVLDGIAIPGLTAGRRADPRLVRSVLERSRLASTEPQVGNELAVPSPQSTRAVEAALEATRHATFDPAAVEAANPLEVEALRFQHPVRVPRYELDDVVYASVGMSLQRTDESSSTSPRQQDGADGVIRSRGGRHLDDLVDATFEKMADRRAQQRMAAAAAAVAAPDIQQHLCRQLLIPPPRAAPAAIYFAEHALPLVPQSLLLLPIPLPPTSVAIV